MEANSRLQQNTSYLDRGIAQAGAEPQVPPLPPIPAESGAIDERLASLFTEGAGLRK